MFLLFSRLCRRFVLTGRFSKDAATSSKKEALVPCPQPEIEIARTHESQEQNDMDYEWKGKF